MKLDYARNAKDPTYFIAASVRNGSRVSTVKVETIGKHSDLLKITDDPLAYARKKVEEYNQSLKQKVVTCTAEINLNEIVTDPGCSASKPTYLNIGYFFLQAIYQKLMLGNFFERATGDTRITFDCGAINRFLTYARILDPKSKLGIFDDLAIYFEQPQFGYHQILRFMDVLASNYDEYLAHLYKASSQIVARDASVLYYDCTNYYFESERYDEDIVDEVTGEVIEGLRKFALSKDHRPNPVVEMGLVMDSRGIPITMCLHPGNKNEQVTAVPLEEEVIKMTENSRFIYCADAGLGSYNIRKFNSMGGRAFIVTQSIKKLSDVLKQAVFNDYDYRLLSSERQITLKEMKEFDKFDPDNRDLYEDRAYKVICADKVIDLGLDEYRTLKNGKTKKFKAKGTLKQRIIITFSRKMMEYQRTVRGRQIERARNLLKTNDPEQIKKGPNDIRRFLKRKAQTKSGEEASVTYELDEGKILEEEKYDGYYAVATNLNDPAKDILAIMHKRYQIEDCFRIMKTSFDARPVYHRNPDRIKAHFLICYTALLIYCLLEVKMDDEGKHHTVEEVRTTLKNMNVSEEFSVYYKALFTGSSTLTDLVSVFGLPLDHIHYQAKDLNKMIKNLRERKTIATSVTR